MGTWFGRQALNLALESLAYIPWQLSPPGVYLRFQIHLVDC
jgi:hypothetical protein